MTQVTPPPMVGDEIPSTTPIKAAPVPPKPTAKAVIRPADGDVTTAEPTVAINKPTAKPTIQPTVKAAAKATTNPSAKIAARPTKPAATWVPKKRVMPTRAPYKKGRVPTRLPTSKTNKSREPFGLFLGLLV
jgi:hypothetical protein